VTPRLPGVSPRQAARALERAGWHRDRVKGSHHVFRHPDRPNRVVVPMHSRDLAKGTLNQIINGSGVTRDEFLRLLK
jgi:predicted RNA binding protein YcfA (HicA-like mRNA interferase family)